jgi:hypothetical protein
VFLILLICTMVSLVKGPFSTCLWWPLHLDNWYLSLCIGHGCKSIKKPVRAQNYRHLHFTLTMILMISNIYDIYKKNKNKYRYIYYIHTIFNLYQQYRHSMAVPSALGDRCIWILFNGSCALVTRRTLFVCI